MPVARTKRKQTSPKRLIRPWHIGAIVAVGGALAVALIVAGQPDSAPAVTPTIPPTSTASYPIEGKAKGFAAAPVTIVEYSDFQCPYCARFAQEIVPALEKEYIATGKVRFEYKHMAQIGEESILAAEATECARDQGRFWDFHDLLFASQNGENRGAFSRERLKGFASRLGLDRNAFDSCLGSGKYRATVTQETNAARSLGIRGTPSMVINGQVVQGLPDLPNLRVLLNAKLAEKGK